MANFTAKDVQALRQATGAGMMDAKRALEENDGDMERSKDWLREKGLAASLKRSDRENVEGAVALARDGDVAALVQLKSETDFVAKSPDFKQLADELATAVVADGEGGAEARAADIETLKINLKENIELGQVVRVEAGPGNALGTYLHVQNERGVNGVIVEVAGGDAEVARELALHVAFTKPAYLSREQVPAEDVDAERKVLEAATREEGKPEQAIPKIVEGKLNGFFADRCLLEQKYVRDEKRTIRQLLGDASVVRFAQVRTGS